ncbi:MAG: hypothetical protein AAF587_25420 [Bacteroidota bacterium]
MKPHWSFAMGIYSNPLPTAINCQPTVSQASLSFALSTGGPIRSMGNHQLEGIAQYSRGLSYLIEGSVLSIC